jgi:acyl-CoA dehydrogenase
VGGHKAGQRAYACGWLQDVKVPLSNMLLGEGRGFEIAQGRLGPGRLHHCMRLIGMGERAMELMGQRALQRVAFGKAIAQHGSFASEFARCRVELTAARLTVLDAAHALDKQGNKRVSILICLASPSRNFSL